MLKNLWPKLVKGATGFLIGIGFWWAFSSPYARLLAALSEPVIRITVIILIGVAMFATWSSRVAAPGTVRRR